MLSYRSRRLTSLVALFALLWGLVFPTLANAGIGDTNTVWAEVCTAQGIQKVRLGADAADSNHHYAAEHCSLCCLGGSLPATPAAQLVGRIDFSQPTPPAPPAILPPQSRVLLSAAPRAPPVLS